MSSAVRAVLWWRFILDVMQAYRRCHNRFPNLIYPKRYTEKIQWRKLFDRDPLYTVFCDKIAAREFIAERVGRALLVPLLWVGERPEDIPFDEIAPPFVLKSSHASGHAVVVEKALAPADIVELRRAADGWLRYCHGTALAEPGYINVPRRLLLEQLLRRADGSPPIERKVFVFHGRACVVQTVTVTGMDRKRFVSHHTLDWRELPWIVTFPPPSHPIEPPIRFAEMIDIAERVASGLEHLRVDIYECDNKFYIGELTPYSFSGLNVFRPDDADYELGAHWSLASPRRRALMTMLRHAPPY